MMWGNPVYSKVLNQSYRGYAEECSYTFTVNKPDQLGARWNAIEHLDAHIVKLQEQGAVVLQYYLWEDRTPTWSTNYYCRIKASDPTGNALPWALIILGVIVLLSLLVTFWIIKEVKQIFESGGGPALTAAVSLLALAGIGLVTVFGVYLVRKKPP